MPQIKIKCFKNTSRALKASYALKALFRRSKDKNKARAKRRRFSPLKHSTSVWVLRRHLPVGRSKIKIYSKIKIKSRYPVAVAVSFFASTRAKHSPEQAPAGATNTRQNGPRWVVPCVLSVPEKQKRVGQ